MQQIDVQHALSELGRSGVDIRNLLLIVPEAEFDDAAKILSTSGSMTPAETPHLATFTIRLKHARHIKSGFLLVPDPFLKEPPVADQKA